MKVYSPKFIFVSLIIGAIIVVVSWLGYETQILPFQKNNGIVINDKKRIYDYKNIFEKINASIDLNRKNYHLEK